MRSPSGDHAGLTWRSRPDVSFRTPLPSACATEIFRPGPMNAMALPSGDHEGVVTWAWENGEKTAMSARRRSRPPRSSLTHKPSPRRNAEAVAVRRPCRVLAAGQVDAVDLDAAELVRERDASSTPRPRGSIRRPHQRSRFPSRDTVPMTLGAPPQPTCSRSKAIVPAAQLGYRYCRARIGLQPARTASLGQRGTKIPTRPIAQTTPRTPMARG